MVCVSRVIYIQASMQAYYKTKQVDDTSQVTPSAKQEGAGMPGVQSVSGLPQSLGLPSAPQRSLHWQPGQPPCQCPAPGLVGFSDTACTHSTQRGKGITGKQEHALCCDAWKATIFRQLPLLNLHKRWTSRCSGSVLCCPKAGGSSLSMDAADILGLGWTRGQHRTMSSLPFLLQDSARFLSQYRSGGLTTALRSPNPQQNKVFYLEE